MPLLPVNLPNEFAPESLTGGEGASFSAPVRTPSPPCTYPTIMEGTHDLFVQETHLGRSCCLLP